MATATLANKYIIIGVCVFLQLYTFQGNDITLKQLLEIGNNKETILLKVTSVDESLDGYIFVVDEQAYAIKKFDHKGRLVGEYNKINAGDYKFKKRPYLIDVSNEFVAVAEFNSPRVLIFSKDLVYKKTIYAKGFIFSIDFDHMGNLWVGAIQIDKKVYLYQYDLNNRLLKTIRLKNSDIGKFEFEGLFNFRVSKNGKIIVAHSFVNKIEVWDTNGKFLNEFKVPNVRDLAEKRVVRINIFSKEEYPKGIVLGGVTLGQDDKIYILSGDYSNMPFKKVYIFNVKGNYLDSLILPSRVSKILLNSKNELLTIENKQTLIRKYKLEIIQ